MVPESPQDPVGLLIHMVSKPSLRTEDLRELMEHYRFPLILRAVCFHRGRADMVTAAALVACPKHSVPCIHFLHEQGL